MTRIFARDARLVLNPRDEWAAIAAEQTETPRLWRRVAVVTSALCAMDLLEFVFCDPGLFRSGVLRRTAFIASAGYFVLNVFSIAALLWVWSSSAPLLSKSIGGHGDDRSVMALAVYANVNTGWIALNALSVDAACHGAATRWIFGEPPLAYALSWFIFAAYVAYAVHLSRSGAMALLGVPAERATAFALFLLLPGLAGVWLLDVGPTPLRVLLGLLGA